MLAITDVYGMQPDSTRAAGRCRRWHAFAGTSAMLAALVVAQAVAAETIAILHGTVIDPAGSPEKMEATVLIDGDKIVAVDRAVEIPSGARVIDARGKFLVPGLWDMHGHLAAFTPVGSSPERYVASGVLGVRDMGGFLDRLMALKAEIASGRRVGPDLVIAGPTVNGPPRAAPFHRVVADAAEARRAVAELKRAGVDFIKIHRQTTREAFFAIVEETRLHGLALTGHVPLQVSWIEAANAGMAIIEHIQTIYENLQPDPAKLVAEFPELQRRLLGAEGDAIWATLVKNGTYFDPTMVFYQSTIEAKAEMAAKRHLAFEAMKALMRRAHRAGVRLLAGTDAGERAGEQLLRELEMLVEIGLTPQQALATATTNPAAALRRAGPGRIVAGAPASLLLLDADPLVDIAHLRRLSLVILRGKILEAAELARLRELKGATK